MKSVRAALTLSMLKYVIVCEVDVMVIEVNCGVENLLFVRRRVDVIVRIATP